ncbi:hypothetical protein IAT38_003423 [Cryptococcus sp. DSM 104549]
MAYDNLLKGALFPVYDHIVSLSALTLGLYALGSLAALLLVLYLYLWPINGYRLPYRHLPGPTPPSIFWGSLKTVLSHSHPNTIYAEWLSTYGPTLKYHILLGFPRVLTADPVAISYVFSHPTLFPKPSHGRAILADMLGNGLVVAEGADHKKQRRALNPSFSMAAVKGMVPIFFDKAYELRERLLGVIENDYLMEASPTPPREEDKAPGGRKVDMLKWTGKATLDIIGLAGFDYDFKALSESSNELAEAYGQMFEVGMGISAITVVQSMIPFLRIIPTHKTKVLNASLSTTRRIGMEIIERKKRAVLEMHSGGLEKKEDIGNDVLSILIKANVASEVLPDHKLSDNEVLDQITTFMLAGNETSSTGLTWILYTLAQHPDAQAKLREECLAVPGDYPPIETLLSLPYMDAVVKEVLRLCAPVPTALREASEDCVIPLGTPVVGKDGKVMDHVRVNKGTPIVMPSINVNTSPDIWGPTAHLFDPTRFLNPTPETHPVTTSAVPGVYANLLTFLGGTRNCIGYRFALSEMKTLLFVLMRGFEFEELGSRPEIERKVSVVMRPRVVREEAAGLQLPLFVKPLAN